MLGLACGVLSGLGVGGGSLLLLYFTVFGSLDAQTARGINLLFFLPTALVALLLHGKHGDIDWHIAIPALAAGCLCSGAIGLLAPSLDSRLLHSLFGGFLLLAGGTELYAGLKK